MGEAGKLEFWLDEETRIPLRIRFDIPVGWAVLELTSANHPKLTSENYRQRRGKR